MKEYRRIIISRTDSIGDVVLTLPVAGMLKRMLPRCTIIFLGRSYTRPVIAACSHVDEFLDWDELSSLKKKDAAGKLREAGADLIIHVFPRKEIAMLARKTGIPHRLGTTNRLYHWNTCNLLVKLSRRRSALHEAQLNLELIGKISGRHDIPLVDIPSLYGLDSIEPLDASFRSLLADDRMNVVLHPKSKGSAREWGLENFTRLTQLLPPEKCRIFITGTEEEGKMFRNTELFKGDNVIDISGKMSLGQLMSFIKSCDSLVAASTGPLHIAAALGIRAIGIYPPIKPMHPGRWAPLGKRAQYLVLDKTCEDCRLGGQCHCITEIRPEEVASRIC